MFGLVLDVATSGLRQPEAVDAQIYLVEPTCYPRPHSRAVRGGWLMFTAVCLYVFPHHSTKLNDVRANKPSMDN